MGVIDNLKDFFKRDDGGRNREPMENQLEIAPRPVEFKADDWANTKTSLGTGFDKKMYSAPLDTILSVTTLDTMYQSSDITSTMIDIPADEMLRQGYKIKLSSDDQDDSQLDDFKSELEAFGINQKFTLGEKFNRLYGGGGIFVGVNDGLNPWDPLDLTKIKSVEYLTLLDRYELVNSGLIDTSVKSINFAKPQYYTLATIDPRFAGIRIHYSRVIRFDGIPMSRRREAFFAYWGQSLINRIYNIIRDYETSHDAIASMIQDFNTLVIQMKDLAAMQAGSPDSKALFKARVKMATQLMSLLNALILREGETAEHITRNVAGLPELIDKMVDRIVVASKVPRILLLGKSAGAGLHANTDNEVRMFYDYIKTVQKNYLEPKLRKMIQIFMASKTGAFAGQVKDFQIEFNPLWQLDDKDAATVKLQMAQADNFYITNGTLTPEEVAQSRWGTGKFNTETTLDDAMRTKVKKVNTSKKIENDPNKPGDIPDGDFSYSMGEVASASGSYPAKRA